ncbi:MAG: helix-turn-helix domain-containing protein [Alphaproteobacteria bacterium]
MDAAPDAIEARLAARLRALRADRGLTLEGLAERSGVSRSMISLVERGESSPTASVLNRLAMGLGVALADLFDEAERPDASPLSRRAGQGSWRDPETGYVRRNLSPPGYPSPIELVEVLFPAGARVFYENAPRAAGIAQQVWVLEGTIEMTAGEETYLLEAGDCLAMRLDRPTGFRNPTDRPARYLVALAADPEHRR